MEKAAEMLWLVEKKERISMFSRINDFFVVTVDNVKALEAVSEWIYSSLTNRYFIQIEQFSNMTAYHICIQMRADMDEKVKQKIVKYLELKNAKLLEKKG